MSHNIDQKIYQTFEEFEREELRPVVLGCGEEQAGRTP